MTDDERIPTHLWLEAKIREISASGGGVYVIQRGEKMGGLVLCKISDTMGQCKLLTQQRDLDGVLSWMNALKDDVLEEKQADDYIQRAVNRDPDLWVVEIEDREMNNPFMD